MRKLYTNSISMVSISFSKGCFSLCAPSSLEEGLRGRLVEITSNILTLASSSLTVPSESMSNSMCFISSGKSTLEK